MKPTLILQVSLGTMLLSAVIGGPCFAFAQSQLDSKLRCENGFIDDISARPLIIDWTELRDIRQDAGSRNLVGLKGNTRVFIKTRSGGPVNGLLPEAVMASKLAQKGIGPRFFGQTLNPETNQPALVFARIAGELYIPKFRYDSRRDIFIGPLPNFEIPAGVKISQTTVRDVQLAFDALDDLAILAEDAQFLLTPDGHAVLIDFGAFSEAKSVEEAKAFNQTLRSIYNRGLEGRLKK